MINLSREKQEELAKKENLTKKDFELVFKAYHDRIFNFINSRVSSREDAEDLTSLVFERVMNKLGDFQWQGITITAWIYRIARNAIIDFYRKNSERRKDSSVDEIGNFLVADDEVMDVALIQGEDEVKLYNALREFKEEDQYLIYYKFFEELSNQEIGQITGMTDSNVGTRLHRIREKLKILLEIE